MRTLLNLAHFHGAVLGTSWQLVLATLQVIFPSQEIFMPCCYALFCYDLVFSCSVSNRRTFEFSHGVMWIALNKYCRISLEFCLAGRLVAHLNTVLISSLPEKWSFCIFQHLVWILGLKPSVGGALKPGRAVEGPSTVSMMVFFS